MFKIKFCVFLYEGDSNFNPQPVKIAQFKSLLTREQTW